MISYTDTAVHVNKKLLKIRPAPLAIRIEGERVKFITCKKALSKLQTQKNGRVDFDPISSPSKCMIDPMLSLGCCAVSLVPLVAFWVAVMTPAESRKTAAGPK